MNNKRIDPREPVKQHQKVYHICNWNPRRTQKRNGAEKNLEKLLAKIIQTGK